MGSVKQIDMEPIMWDLINDTKDRAGFSGDYGTNFNDVEY